LYQLGFRSILIIEKEAKPHKHSKSLGLHPPSIAMLESLGLFSDFEKNSVQVERGIAFSGTNKLGELSFQKAHPKHSMVWIIPQWRNEELLRQKVMGIGISVLFEASIIEIDNSGSKLKIEQGENFLNTGYRFLVICEGKASHSRSLLGIGLHGSSYPDTYVMADVKDATRFGNSAVVNLHKDGLVESFPLPNGCRRWVCKTDARVDSGIGAKVVALVRERTDIDFNESDFLMESSFSVEQLLAEKVVANNIFLAGDSAHIISPIGGQGMNLGWMDAWDLAAILHGIGEKRLNLKKGSQLYSHFLNKRFREARFRAWFNMMMGRKSRLPFLKKPIIKALLSPYLNKLMARRFSMYGLPRFAD
jgi:2-polyprenyl-6-methoxyphenol hydroxylase-like FAD-dependent oxidoreductase